MRGKTRGTGRMSRGMTGWGVVLATLAAMVVAPLSPAAAAGTLSISGTVALAGPITTSPTLSVDAWAEDGSIAGHIETTGTSYTIPALSPGSYTVQVRVLDSADTWATTWYGDTAIQARATTVNLSGVSRTGIDISVPRGGAISGNVSSPGGPADATNVWVDTFLFDEVSGGYWWMGGAYGGSSGAYRVGQLSPGQYLVMFSDARTPSRYADSYYPGTTDYTQIQTVPVASATTTPGINGALGEWSFSTGRIAGLDRFQTSAAVSAVGFEKGVDVVYVASGANWPDALSAGPAAAHLGGPLLLVTRDAIPPTITQELDYLDPARIVVVGGTASISDGVAQQLRQYAPRIDRVSGADRFATSRAVVRDAFGSQLPPTLYVAAGSNYPDALSAGAAAAESLAPVLLVNGGQSTVDSATAALLSPSDIGELIVVGGPASIGAPLYNDLGRFADEKFRKGGADRFETNRLVIEFAFRGPYWANAGVSLVASGYGFADGLSGVPLAAMLRAPIILSPASCLPQGALQSARQVHSPVLWLIGGEAVLDSSVANLVTCGAPAAPQELGSIGSAEAAHPSPDVRSPELAGRLPFLRGAMPSTRD
ncbi:cell wall-binding repeat-containing protein [Compostimonas suwonensis]|uniref:Putative cell wall binding repeat protein n=1 Tax=Compostimonas suwonensis TaxID=1048394 RepID=A0A2M9BV43_9MICO|nr:cell wall-binding repeat-containing protein [Compostimonas suwonensis]PJJ61752.1 putative cell wall binding repeat protein [Compostimonas suwonensis]